MTTDWGALFNTWAPVIGAGIGLYGAYQQGNAQADYNSAVQQQQQWKLDNAKATHAAFQDYANQIAGLYGGYAGAVGANNAAHQAAFMASEQARLAQGKKARKRLRRANKKSRNLLNPYQQAGIAMLPYAQQTAQRGFGNLALMDGYLNNPNELAKLSQSGPALLKGAQAGLGAVPSWVQKDPNPPQVNIQYPGAVPPQFQSKGYQEQKK